MDEINYSSYLALDESLAREKHLLSMRNHMNNRIADADDIDTGVRHFRR